MARIIDKKLGKDREYDSVKSAVEDALRPDVYSYEGEVDKLKEEVKKLQEMLASLLENMYGESQYRYNKCQQLQDILGYDYEVEEL